MNNHINGSFLCSKTVHMTYHTFKITFSALKGFWAEVEKRKKKNEDETFQKFVSHIFAAFSTL